MRTKKKTILVLWTNTAKGWFQRGQLLVSPLWDAQDQELELWALSLPLPLTKCVPLGKRASLPILHCNGMGCRGVKQTQGFWNLVGTRVFWNICYNMDCWTSLQKF